MILHISTDSLFTDIVINLFEKVNPNGNRYIVLSDSPNIEHISNFDKIEIMKPDDILTPSFISKLNIYQAVLLHYLDFYKAKLVTMCEFKVNFIWLAWGGDFYGMHPRLKKKLLLPKTKKLKWQIEKKKEIIGLIGKLFDVFGLVRNYYKEQERALPKITYCAPVIYDDYVLIKETYTNAKKLKFLPFVYGDLTIFTHELKNDKIGTNILLGNSATYTNNHVEIIEILSKINLDHKKVITPLNYGDSTYAKYAKAISKFGNEKLPSNFLPIMDYKPLREYWRIISSCGYVIMNFNRQQGMGNIYAMLLTGAKVFIRKENPAYRFFKRKGIYIHEVNEIEINKEKAFLPLSLEQKFKNKSILNDLLSPAIVQSYAAKIVNVIGS